MIRKAADFPAPDTGHFRDWTLKMLYEVEPQLKDIADRAIAKKCWCFEKKLEAYVTAKNDAWKLVGWEARDSRLRSHQAWDCFFNYILEELKI